MLMDRIVGAFTFKREVYAEVEKDTSFTNTAWAIVAVVALLNSLGSYASAESFGNWIVQAIVGALFTILGFALAAFVIAWMGKTLFSAEVSFDEMVRTLGLAYVWNVVGAIGVLTFFVPLLGCILSPAILLSWILGIYSWFIAAREALDLESGQTIVTVIIGWIVVFVVSLGAGIVLGILGLGAAAVTGAFS